MEATTTKATFQKYPAYKNSGVEWLGEIPEHWEVFRLASLGRFSASGIDKIIKKGESPVKIINYTDVYKNLKQTITKDFDLMVVTTPESNRINNLVKKGDLIFLPSSETFEDLGLSALVNEDLENTSFSYHVLRFSFTKELNHNFKKYFTNNSKVLIQFSKKGTGSIRKTLSRNDFRNTLVIIPPIIEQEKIATFLDDKTTKIERAIAQKEKMITLLKERKQIIIQNAVTKGLDPNAKMKDSGVEWIGEIPEGWKTLSNKNIFKLIKNQVGKNSSKYDLLSLTLRGIIKRDMENPEGKFPAEFDTYQEVKKGDFVFCLFDVEETPRTVGLSAYDGMITGAYTVLRTFKEVNNYFLYYFYLNLDSRKELKYLYKGLRNTIPKDSFFSFKSLIPPLSEQNEIVNYIETQSSKIDKAIQLQEQQIEKLKELKSTLIDSAVTGKIKVS